MDSFIKNIPDLGFSTVPIARYRNGPLECYVRKTVPLYRALFVPLKAFGVPNCNLISVVVALPFFIKPEIQVIGGREGAVGGKYFLDFFYRFMRKRCKLFKVDHKPIYVQQL